MLRTRVMPCLLLRGQGLVKTRRFKNERYIGDPINAVRIFNQKEVDELVLIDIDATTKKNGIQFELIEDIVSECFMPICYSGGVKKLDDFRRLFYLGVEKVSVSSALFDNPTLIEEAVKIYGSQSIVVTLDVKQHWLTKKKSVYIYSGGRNTNVSAVAAAKSAEELGAGEIIIYSIDRDGTWQGFDLGLVREVVDAVNVPVVACGGAGSMTDVQAVVKEAGASAVALGSMAVFQARDAGVLIKFPKISELEELLK